MRLREKHPMPHNFLQNVWWFQEVGFNSGIRRVVNTYQLPAKSWYSETNKCDMKGKGEYIKCKE
jgi:hypothetical protein